jgi:uncharacterized protein
MAPFYQFDFFGEQTSFIIAVLIGISFGFWLERAGFAESRKLALQFYFKEMTVLKVMFTAIVVAMLGLAYLTLFGELDINMVYINPTFLGAQAVGGLMLGAGMVIGGFCPGTSVVGASIGRIDAYLFLAGVFFGMLVFGEIFPWIEGLYLSGDMGRITLMEYFDTTTGIIIFLVMIMAVGMFLGGEWLEKKFRTGEAQ